jgi:hypothetical protein
MSKQEEIAKTLDAAIDANKTLIEFLAGVEGGWTAKHDHALACIGYVLGGLGVGAMGFAIADEDVDAILDNAKAFTELSR